MRHWLRVRVDYCVTPAGGSSRIRFDSGSDRSILSILSRFFISIIDTETLGVERAGRGVEREGWKVLREETGLDEFENIGFPGVRMRFDMAEVVIPFELGLRNTVPLKKRKKLQKYFDFLNFKNQHDRCPGFQLKSKITKLIRYVFFLVIC